MSKFAIVNEKLDLGDNKKDGERHSPPSSKILVGYNPKSIFSLA